MGYLTNQVMEWNGKKVSDHNRQPLNESVERIERKQRMADGTMRRYVVSKKRTWTTSWDNLPSRNGVTGYAGTVDGGMSGEELEAFHRTTNDKFLLCIRDGQAQVVTSAINIDTLSVPAVDGYPLESVRNRINRGVMAETTNGLNFCWAMITDFSKDIVKRGPGIDWWNLSITIEEV